MLKNFKKKCKNYIKKRLGYEITLQISQKICRIKNFPKAILKQIFSICGYEAFIQLSKKVSNLNKSLNNLNIGAGDYIISDFKSLDFFSPHYYKNKSEFLKKRIEYDIRKDNIPFKEETVDNIYISHVIEHIETNFVEKFLNESYRVLKKGCVLRIACPDAKFLYNVTKFPNTYWAWRKGYFTGRGFDEEEITQFDFFIRELSTPKLKYNKDRLKGFILESSSIFDMDYNSIVNFLKKDLHFRFKHPGDHINCWDFKQLEILGKKVGFEYVVESKYRGSVSKTMQTPAFDQTCPWMSLYIDMVK